MLGQQSLFPTDDYHDRSFEFKRAQKAQRREDRIGHTDLIIKLPYTYSERLFIVSRTTGQVWHCQACVRNPLCRHIRAIKKLLSLKIEAGYTNQSDRDFLKSMLPVGDIK